MMDRGAFGLFELNVMTAAFEMALDRVGDDVLDRFDDRTLRRRIVAGITDAAQSGITDPEDLADEGLHFLRDAAEGWTGSGLI